MQINSKTLQAISFVLIVLFSNCSWSKKDTKPDFLEACCCGSTFNIEDGSFKTFAVVPTGFSPNGDNINDKLQFFATDSIKCITDVVIKTNSEVTGTVLARLDTVIGGLNNKTWNGLNQANVLYEGTFDIIFTMHHKNGNNFLRQSKCCSYICSSNNIINFNKQSCVLGDQITFPLGISGFNVTQDPCFR